MVQGVEDLRTPLSEIIYLDKKIRGTLSGFMMPSFVVDLPGGGGKRLVSTHESYENGVATYRAPGLDGPKATTLYTYHDPKPVEVAEMAKLSEQKAQALETGQTLEELIQSTFFNPSHRPAATPYYMPAISQAGGSQHVQAMYTPTAAAASDIGSSYTHIPANSQGAHYNLAQAKHTPPTPPPEHVTNNWQTTTLEEYAAEEDFAPMAATG
jgi:lysine 2,3-aminomutase